MRELFTHQHQGVEFLQAKKKAILADEMGLGKTTQAIVSAVKESEPTLVVCPATLKTNWAREIVMIDPDATVGIVESGKLGNIHQYNVGGGTEWLVINYDLLEKYGEDIGLYLPFKTLILDEAHYIKNQSTKRTKVSLNLAKYARRVYLLTGTPILNRPMELYTLLKAIDHPIAENWYGYAKKYCGAYMREVKRRVYNPITKKSELKVLKFLETGGATNLVELHQHLKPVYLRRTKDILGDSLPEKIITNLELELSSKDKKLYDGAWDKYYDYLEKNPDEVRIQYDLSEREIGEKLGNIQATRHLIELNKLKQVCSLAKIPTILERVADIVEQGEKVIVFSQYNETIDQIKTELRKAKIQAVSIQGDNDANERQKAVDAFQKDEGVQVFVGNIKACGVGITLTKASTVLFADMEWTPGLNSQAEDRAHRIGQTKLVNIYYYTYKETIEEDIVELLDKKSQIIKKVLEGKDDKVKDISIAGKLVQRLQAKKDIHSR